MSLRFRSVLGASFTVALALGSLWWSAPTPAHAASFDQSNLIADSVFVNTNAMTTPEVQAFLNAQGGFLKDFSENGRSAAQIIVDASHGYGDAAGSINGITIDSSTGTVNPEVLLVTLQKEQSLVTMASRSDSALNTAMGYGCPDSGGCDSAYRGFTKQVENAAWQFRYNYERAQGHSFGDYQVGQSFCFDDSGAGHGTDCGTYGNRATASLYRYTPHVYNGNYNFTQFFANWFTTPLYATRWGGQSSNPSLSAGQSAQLTLTLVNTGSATWTPSTVHLATSHGQDHVLPFTREDVVTHQPSGWATPSRMLLQESSVVPGQVGHFSFWISVPAGMSPGSYRVDVQAIADGVTWFPDLGINWQVTVQSVADQYHARWAGQNDYPSLNPGQSAQLTVAYVNTGSATWTPSTIHLATSHGQDHVLPFTREDVVTHQPSGWATPSRMLLQESSVAPGQTGHFSFWISVPTGLSAGQYPIYVQPVADGITWMEDQGVSWVVTVRSLADTYHARWGGQNDNPTLAAGQSANLQVAFLNTGSTTWTPSTVHLATSHGQDHVLPFIREDVVTHQPSGWASPSRMLLQESSVAPGQVGHFTFWISVPTGLSAGQYPIYVQPVADGITWMEDQGVSWVVTVH